MPIVLLPAGALCSTETSSESVMKLYRVDKLAKRGGAVVKRRHILANSDRQAIRQAEESDDCPVCDVLRDGERVGQVV
jgi:hypothetical protein